MNQGWKSKQYILCSVHILDTFFDSEKWKRKWNSIFPVFICPFFRINFWNICLVMLFVTRYLCFKLSISVKNALKSCIASELQQLPLCKWPRLSLISPNLFRKKYTEHRRKREQYELYILYICNTEMYAHKIRDIDMRIIVCHCNQETW